MKQAVIYVFGLGDHRSRGQQFVMRLWKLYGLETSVYHMQWRVAGRLEDKLAGLLQRIDTLAESGHQVSLVGTSAGASAVIHAYAQRHDRIHRVVCICGKLQHPETLHPATFRQNPAFKESLEVLPTSLAKLSDAQRARILSIRPLRDHVVPPADTYIEGARARLIPTTGHVLSIALAITVLSRTPVHFIKSR